MARKTKDGVKRLTLELDGEHYATLKALAQEEGRSMHSQVLYLIRDAMRRASKRSPQP